MVEVTVTQRDRDAAADAVKAYRDSKNNDWQARIRRGECDDGYMVQAFARHRASAPDAEPVAWMYEREGRRHVSPTRVTSSRDAFYGWTETPLYTNPAEPAAICTWAPPCGGMASNCSWKPNDDKPCSCQRPAEPVAPAVVEALAKGGFMMTEPHNIGEHRARKLVIGFQNASDADEAMFVIGRALKALAAMGERS